MLKRCRAAAAELGISVTLHQQKMEAMRLERRYRRIFLAGPTFNPLPDDDTAKRALVSIRAHLTDDGQVVVPLLAPTPTPAEQLGAPRESWGADGAVLRVTAVHERFDERNRTRTTLLRYQRQTGNGAVEQAERPWVLHWYEPEAFAHLAANAGLEAHDVRAVDFAAPDGTWHVRLRHDTPDDMARPRTFV